MKKCLTLIYSCYFLCACLKVDWFCVFLCLGIGKLHGTVSTLGAQRGRGQKQRGGCVNWAGPMGIGGGGVIRKTGDRQDAN